MKVFVAGATGALGRQLIPQLLAAGHQVAAMTRHEGKLGEWADQTSPASVAVQRLSRWR